MVKIQCYILIGEKLILYKIYKVIFIQNPVFRHISVFKTKAECNLLESLINDIKHVNERK